jgi:hypothetical protein
VIENIQSRWEPEELHPYTCQSCGKVGTTRSATKTVCGQNCLSALHREEAVQPPPPPKRPRCTTCGSTVTTTAPDDSGRCYGCYMKANVRSRRPANCGSPSGARVHRRHKEPICSLCHDAERLYQNTQREKRKAQKKTDRTPV